MVRRTHARRGLSRRARRTETPRAARARRRATTGTREPPPRGLLRSARPPGRPARDALSARAARREVQARCPWRLWQKNAERTPASAGRAEPRVELSHALDDARQRQGEGHVPAG